jgi:uncharacterized protein
MNISAKSPFVKMHSGKDVPLDDPRFHHILITDIGHHLALTNRFNGATHTPYTVAQHCCVVADILAARKHIPVMVLRGLLHDAHEAYVGDLVSPVKHHLFGGVEIPESYWDRLTGNFDAAIETRFRLRPMTSAEFNAVADADLTALATEWRDLMQGFCPVPNPPATFCIKPWSWHVAEERFLKRFHELAAHAGLHF